MDTFAKAEELVRRTNVSYEEAKEALEASNWDILDAMVYLEKQGKGSPSSKLKKGASDCADSVKRLVRKGNSYNFEMYSATKRVFSIPVTAAVIIGILCIELALPAAVIAMIIGYKFKVSKDGITDSSVQPQYISAGFNMSGNSDGNGIRLEK